MAALSYFGSIAQWARSDPQRLESLFNAHSKKLLMIGAAFALFLLLFGIELFPLVFGEAWREAGVYAVLFAPLVLVEFGKTGKGSVF